MGFLRNLAVGGALSVGAALALGWSGLRRLPAPFAPYPANPDSPATGPFPAGLPAPVERCFRAMLGDRVPVVTSAVITGRGWITLGPLTFPARFRFIHDAGRAYRHYIECTWWRRPVLRVNEWYLGGHARLELPVGVTEGEPKIDLAANLGLWAESLWLPAILLTAPRVRWEPVDATHARLIVPFGDSEDRIDVTFDPATGLIARTDTLRWRSASDPAKLPWGGDTRGWRTLAGVNVPATTAIRWGDQQAPWFVASVEDIVYNVDVTDYIRASGP